MDFAAIGLSEPILRGVTASGYRCPTEIQSRAIPIVLQGKDVIGCAPTGTGKTAAFVLPILHRLGQPGRQHGRVCAPRALVLTPTRELCEQIEEAVRTYGKYCGIRALGLIGGVSIGRQMQGLARGADIVVATPGRLLDHLERRSIDLSGVKILVLDEADRMYDMGFIRDVRKIIARVPSQRQTLLFSATMSADIRGLVAEILRAPQVIEVGKQLTPVATVTHKFYTASAQSKLDLLVHVLGAERVELMLVFSRTKHGADKLAKGLGRRGIDSAVIHSNRSQSQRRLALDGFKRREYRVLVATDLAARGIDVEGVSHVVNYDTPPFAEDYIHRIGRTGRAEASGAAITFVSPEEEKYLRRIGSVTGKRLQLERYPGFTGQTGHTDHAKPTPHAKLPTARPKPMEFGRRFGAGRAGRVHAPRFA